MRRTSGLGTSRSTSRQPTLTPITSQPHSHRTLSPAGTLRLPATHAPSVQAPASGLTYGAVAQRAGSRRIDSQASNQRLGDKPLHLKAANTCAEHLAANTHTEHFYRPRRCCYSPLTPVNLLPATHAPAIFGGGHAHDLLERFGEMKHVAEIQLAGDFLDRVIAVIDRGACPIQTATLLVLTG
jgi:hypothetical protein